LVKKETPSYKDSPNGYHNPVGGKSIPAKKKGKVRKQGMRYRIILVFRIIICTFEV
jgi:hypothetical protein